MTPLAIRELFLLNGYPTTLISKTIRNCLRPSHKHTRRASDQFYIRLPYIDETLTNRVTAAIRSSKAPIKISWTNASTLKKLLVTSALAPPPCPSGHKRCHTCDNGLAGRCATRMAVYKISCRACANAGTQATYIGQSRRPIRVRFNEHLGDARLRRPDTGLGEHTYSPPRHA